MIENQRVTAKAKMRKPIFSLDTTLVINLYKIISADDMIILVHPY